MLERYDDMGQLDQDELDALFVELCGSGYRQVAATLQWLVLYISEIPEVQGKVRFVCFSFLFLHFNETISNTCT
jgi:cytochrome P450